MKVINHNPIALVLDWNIWMTLLFLVTFWMDLAGKIHCAWKTLSIWEQDIFRSGYHGGYLVACGFPAQWSKLCYFYDIEIGADHVGL